MVRNRGKKTFVCVETAIKRKEGGREREKGRSVSSSLCCVHVYSCAPVSD
jgi:hypothetical protein